jgi:hypothetical protein
VVGWIALLLEGMFYKIWPNPRLLLSIVACQAALLLSASVQVSVLAASGALDRHFERLAVFGL